MSTNTETHRPPEVEPAIKHAVSWRVTSMTALPDVVFVAGTTGEVYMNQFLSDSKPMAQSLIRLATRQYSHRHEWFEARCNAPMVPTWRPMRCMTQSANVVSGSLSNFGLTERAIFARNCRTQLCSMVEISVERWGQLWGQQANCELEILCRINYLQLQCDSLPLHQNFAQRAKFWRALEK